ncbi:DNA adenine methylase [Tistrella bauzanensis]|uniref:DNA adenine methylase n=1 Tax=Tistrella TaxID=171436 RepID=UPI0031F61C81
MTVIRTAHRQMGSKARMAHQVAALCPRDTGIWVEVFAGTAAVTLAREPGRSVEHINDANGLITNLYRVMRDRQQLDELCKAIALTPYAQAEFEAAREIWSTPDADDIAPVERARRLLVASWQAIGGKQIRTANWRLDLGRSWLTATWRGVQDRLRATAERLMNVHVHQRHAFEMLAMFGGRQTATLYVDPPYPRETLGTHEVLYAVDMTPTEHVELIERVTRAQARIILSMSPCPLYDDALSDAGWWSCDTPVRGLRNAVKIERIHCNFWPAPDLFSALPPVED